MLQSHGDNHSMSWELARMVISLLVLPGLIRGSTIDNSLQCIIDNLTGLTWARDTSALAANWATGSSQPTDHISLLVVWMVGESPMSTNFKAS